MNKLEQEGETERDARPVLATASEAWASPERILLIAAAGVYAVVVACGVHWHEPWADEAHSWLLARDLSVFELWTKWLHYEGTPGLWQTVLHVLIKIGLPYAGLNAVAGILGFAATCLVLRYAPFPLVIRVALPFTYFLCYQYAAIARSYSLLPVLLFAAAIVSRDFVRRAGLFALLLSLMAAVSVHGVVLSGSIWLAAHGRLAGEWKQVNRPDRNRIAWASVAYAMVVAAVIWSAWPAGDGTFYRSPNLSLRHFFDAVWVVSRDAFTGLWAASLGALALSIPFLWRGRTLLMFGLSAMGLSAIAAVIYAQVWHVGLVFLAWLAAIWMAAYRTRVTRPVIAALAIVSVFQCYWTVRSIGYDRTHAYSGSRATAQYLRQAGITGPAGIGFGSVSIQPYFEKSIFVNYGGDGRRAFWDWSERNRASDPELLFTRERPQYVVVSYKAEPERARWAALAAMGGYRLEKQFDGALFWRTRVLEPEAFDLYRLGGAGGGVLANSVRMSDSAAAKQLLSGFYGLEANAWRWTNSHASVVLAVDPDAARNGARLDYHLIVPDAQIAKLGAMTLSAEVNGYPLAPQTYASAGDYHYVRRAPAVALRSSFACVKLRFDKTLPPSGGDNRELAAIGVSIALEAEGR